MESKTCTKCKESLPLDSFNKHNQTKDGYAYQCKTCVKKYRATRSDILREQRKKWYTANRERINERNRAARNAEVSRWRNYDKERNRKLKQECVDYLGGACAQCGYNECLPALEFHHIDPQCKDFAISRVRSKDGLTLLVKQELDKCILLCCRCHRELHYRLDEAA